MLAGPAAAALVVLLALRRRRVAAAPWQDAGKVTDGLFDAQTELVLSGPARGREGRRARPCRLRRRAARRRCATADPAADRALAAALRDARPRRPRPATRSALAAARGSRPRRALPRRLRGDRRGDRARRRGDRPALAAAARVPHRDPLHAPGRARDARARPARARGKTSPRDGRARPCAKDLLDAYQARLRELLDDARRGIKENLPARRAEAAAQAAGLLRDPRAALRRGPRRGRRARGVGRLRRAAEAGDGLAAALDRADKALEGFTAAPFTPEEAARRAQQLLQFLALVPVEYGRGVKDDQVTRDFEIQEAVAFRTGAVGAFADLRDQLAKRDRGPHRDRARAALDELGRLVGIGAEAARRASPTHEQVEARRRAGRGRAEGRDAAEVDREDRRVRLRPDRAHARPHGGRRRRRPVPPGRAGAAGGVRVLRVRPGAAAALASTRASRSTSKG